MTDLYIGRNTFGTNDDIQALVLKRANRHGLIAGATGTGKTVTLQTIAEGFSRAGVPVFLADVKGDLAGMAVAGSEDAGWTMKRATEIAVPDYAYAANPTVFWDLFGEQGHPIRTTVSEMGPLLISRLLDLTEAQEGVLTIAFRYADEENLMLLDLKDLQSMLAFTADNAKELSARYGNVTRASVGAIQRRLLTLEDQGGAHFFGEPAFDIHDLMRIDPQGHGQVNILAADRLMRSPRLYATFLLWLLAELFETLPEVGDPDKPKLVFFFDEAHLLFDEAPKALLEKVEQVVRLIRSKGVGVYFITQNPVDIPETVAGQLGNRVQHALRAFTPKDARAIKQAAETFRANPGLDVAEAITQLKVGEALVSLLQKDGAPAPVERTLIAPPRARVGPLTAEERQRFLDWSSFKSKYDALADRKSAYEILLARGQQAAEASARAEAAEAEAKAAADAEKARAAAERAERARARSQPKSLTETLATSMARSAASSLGRQLAGKSGQKFVRGLLGSLFK
ncbi:MAG: helicase HerA-like domain-containing protein [Polymorphobacter sp.]|uniref:helicase HerA-like domain-containing protein n=1 Tax=Polymorphobacter sp. TaxID=1909290 RepID=UPI003A84B60E